MYYRVEVAYRARIGARERTTADANLYGNLEELEYPSLMGKRLHLNEGEGLR
jgi:hypothetical protein